MLKLLTRPLALALWAGLALVLLLCLAWSAGAIYYSRVGIDWLKASLAIAWPVAILALMARPATRKKGLLGFGIGFVVIATLWTFKTPAGQGEYPPETATLVHAEIDGNEIVVHDIRDFRYRSEEDFDVRRVTRKYDLARLRTIDVFFSYWDGLKDIAHTFLSFGFEGGEQLVVSVEVRKQVGEEFETLPGIFDRYEIIYIWGTEEDIVGLRTNYRGEDTYLYRLTLEPDLARRLLIDMLEGTNELRDDPKFYNTLFRNCTSSLVDHLNDVFPGRFPWYKRRLMNGVGDQRAYDYGVIEHEGSFAETKKKSAISERGKTGGLGPGFSQRIRTHL